ncbi:MAG TPA: SBBP repeat-containing protein, partial [Acidimicrobiales bacterium]|nr:SBBP repeat-containing protein [Acidimicrobiales bacterium]
MRTQRLWAIGLVLAVLLAVLAVVERSGGGAQPKADASRATPSATPNDAGLEEAYGRLPIAFEANRGQSDPAVKFLSRGPGYNLFLTPTEAVLTLSETVSRTSDPAGSSASEAGNASAGEPGKGSTVRMELLGGNPSPRAVGQEPLAGKVNYLRGDASRSLTDVPTFRRAAFQGVYPGIDLAWYGKQGQLEYDFTVAPGADPTMISLGFEGADRLGLDDNGDLVVDTPSGSLRHQAPFIYQEVGGSRQRVPGRFVLTGDRQVGFSMGAYDTSRPLVIDPVLAYSSYLGGADLDIAEAIAVDSAGAAYVTGRTGSANFPLASPIDGTLSGVADAFITKFDPSGSGLMYSTYFGGSSFEQGNGIAVDSTGAAHVTGSTNSRDFPVTTGAFQQSFVGTSVDAFVAKLNPAGTAFDYSTYLGGTQPESQRATSGQGLDLGPEGTIYVGGRVTTTRLPTTAGAFQPACGLTASGECRDAFLAKINPAGGGASDLLYLTYLGGNGEEEGRAIAVDANGSAHLTGFTFSTDFPITAGAFQVSLAGREAKADVFVTKINPAAGGVSDLLYSTYLGGSMATGIGSTVANVGVDEGNGIALGPSGKIYVAGTSRSSNFPTTPRSAQQRVGGCTPVACDAFLSILDPAGGGRTDLVYST